MENIAFLGSRVSISDVTFFLKFLQIDNNIPYLLKAPKKNYFFFEIFVRKPLEN